ncbi:MAG: sugar phosphate isomerase/epimerase family protein [Thermoguttaceae bacterium]
MTTMNRRTMLATTLAAGAAATTFTASSLAAETKSSPTAWPEVLGWHVAPQAWTFRLFTLEEAIQKAVQVGCRYIEAGANIKITKSSDSVYGYDMSAADRKLVRTLLADHGVSISASGVNGPGKNGWRSLFDFAASMAIPVVGIEPPTDQLAEVDKLAQEYRISVGLHNHPDPSTYWNYKTVLAAIKDCSPWIGSYADTGHWMRSGINPLEAVKALSGRIVGCHLKDLKEFNVKEAADVVWGTGAANMAAIVSELASQNFRGPVSVEYEDKWEDNTREVAACVAFICGEAKKIVTQG